MKIALNRFRELSLILLVSSPAMALTFTGDVANDFTGAYAEVEDSNFDVGMPPNAPLGAVSGWNIDRFLFAIDDASGTLSVGLEYIGIAGDADGNGIDGVAEDWLQIDNEGYDFFNLGESESICMAFDFDQDGTYDLIAGVSEQGDAYRVANFDGGTNRISDAFGINDLPHDGGHFYSPAAASPDFEFALSDFFSLDNYENGVLCFDFIAFSGSFQDDGIGEDNKTARVCFEGTVNAVELPAHFGLSSASPNPFNPTTTLSYNVAQTGSVALSVYNLQGQLVSTLFDGVQGAGEHQVVFQAGNLPSGLYLAHLSTEQGSDVMRLVLTK